VLSPLFFGYEPVGGDPDRIFRPIKLELKRALDQGTLPFWSDKLGFGMPLLAESHAAALYPPNHLIYRLFDVSTAYRLSMWLHNVLIAAATAAYARFLGITPWGAALAGVSFALCGFQAIHSSHEWAYHTLAFLPIVLFCAEKYLATGRLLWMTLLALASGVTWTLGHFQVQTWTCLILGVITVWRVLFDRAPFIRSAGVMVALMWGGLIAAAQLGPSWEVARSVGQQDRDRVYYSFPYEHWIEPFFPAIYRDLDPEGDWTALKTSGYEGAFYVGTIPLVFAIVGALSRNARSRVWVVVTVLTLALATMPRWWALGYEWFLMTPGISLFRCPARWTVFASLGLSILAGAGLEPLVRRWRPALAVLMAIAAWIAATYSALVFVKGLTGDPGPAVRAIQLGGALCVAALVFALGIRRWPRLVPVVVLMATLELAFLYYSSTTQWGWAVRLPQASPALDALEKESMRGTVAGFVDNLPVWTGRPTASPYVGFQPLDANDWLQTATNPMQLATSQRYRPAHLRSMGMTHVLMRVEEVAAYFDRSVRPRVGDLILGCLRVVWVGEDAALTRTARPAFVARTFAPWLPQSTLENPNDTWVVLRYESAETHPRLYTRAIVTFTQREAGDVAANQRNNPDPAAILTGLPYEVVAAANSSAAKAAALEAWNGRAGVVSHDGACILVLKAAHYPGWHYRVNAGPWQPCISANGGLQALLLEGRGPSSVEVRYFVTGWPIVATASALSTALALAVAAWSIRRSKIVTSSRTERSPAARAAAVD
jgi:hypothetical protein